MPQDFYELVWIFVIYAFLGWCMEVSYAAVDMGVFVNRGFLNGPYCPIYGAGIVIVVELLTPLKENFFILFLGSFLLTSVLEFITGFLLEKVFHNKWWDYSDKPFNIKGYVCLKFSLYWGFACVFVMDILHPAIYKMITVIPHIVGLVVLILWMVVFITDLCITVMSILKFNKRMKSLEEIAVRIHDISDDIGEVLYENVMNIMEKSEEFQESHEEFLTHISQKKESSDNRKQELEALKTKYRELMSGRFFGTRRLLSAFPNIKSKSWDDVLQKYKELQKKNHAAGKK